MIVRLRSVIVIAKGAQLQIRSESRFDPDMCVVRRTPTCDGRVRRDRRRERRRRLRIEMATLNAARREQIGVPWADRSRFNQSRRVRHPPTCGVPVAAGHASGLAAALVSLCGVTVGSACTRLPPDVAAQIVRHVAAMRIASACDISAQTSQRGPVTLSRTVYFVSPVSAARARER